MVKNSNKRQKTKFGQYNEIGQRASSRHVLQLSILWVLSSVTESLSELSELETSPKFPHLQCLTRRSQTPTAVLLKSQIGTYSCSWYISFLSTYEAAVSLKRTLIAKEMAPDAKDCRREL